MKVLHLPASILFCSALAAGAQSPGATPSPRFVDFATPAESIRKAAPVRLAGPEPLLYATQLREASRHKPDFAGHYILASWGCGASCVMAAAIDAKTGAVVMLPFTVSNWPLDVTEPLGHRLNSRLLIVRGQRNEKGSGTSFYELANHTFKLVRQFESKP